MKRISAEGAHVDIEWFDPIAPRSVEQGATEVECRLFAEDMLAEAERRRGEAAATLTRVV